MNIPPESIVIVGAGQAGGWAAKTLRSEGFEGRITLIGSEDHPPYERPPLSKEVLAGEADPTSTFLFKPEIFDSLNLELLRNEHAVEIESEQRLVHCSSGRAIAYDRLLLATGGRARPIAIEGLDADEILLLRTLEDAETLRRKLSSSRSIAVIGGGWIGLEVAATARKLGLAVHLFELAERLCARAAPPLLSDFLFDLHSRHGTDLHLSESIKSGEKRSDGTYLLETQKGKTIHVDVVIAGVGLIPNEKLARNAGLKTDNGIVTGADGMTSNPQIFAAGDVANSMRPFVGRNIRYESWANAQNQGIAVAKSMLEQTLLEEDPPWFWSDQYGVNIQIIGLPDENMQPIIRGDRKSDGFSIFYLRTGEIAAAITINAPRDMTIVNRLMTRGIAVDSDILQDESIPLKGLLKAR